MITNIGARTAKGTLIRGMLFPSSYRFTFTEHLKVVFALLILWGIVLLFTGIAILESSVESWFFGMSTISQVLSPLLPTVLSIGQAVAGERLRKKKIACWDLNRITIAGKVRFFCFDKTGKLDFLKLLGTLTKDHIEFIGAQGIDIENKYEDPQMLFDSFSDSMKHIMLTCHTLSTVFFTSYF
jgi:cation-transporting ATPase 13A3/4/5